MHCKSLWIKASAKCINVNVRTVCVVLYVYILAEYKWYYPGHRQMIKSGSKDIYNITKDFYFTQIGFFWIFYSSKNPEKLNVSRFPRKYSAARLFSTLIIIRNVSRAYYYDFWRSCDTGVMMLEIQLRITLFYIVKIFPIFTAFFNQSTSFKTSYWPRIW